MNTSILTNTNSIPYASREQILVSSHEIRAIVPQSNTFTCMTDNASISIIFLLLRIHLTTDLISIHVGGTIFMMFCRMTIIAVITFEAILNRSIINNLDYDTIHQDNYLISWSSLCQK